MDKKTNVFITGYEIKEDCKYEQEKSQLIVELTFVSQDKTAYKYHDFLMKLKEFLRENYNYLNNIDREEQELININKLRSKYGLEPIPDGDIDLIPIK